VITRKDFGQKAAVCLLVFGADAKIAGGVLIQIQYVRCPISDRLSRIEIIQADLSIDTIGGFVGHVEMVPGHKRAGVKQ
jgi:hypothetical protein